MSERKVLNKYYPADYDPSKIPKGKRNRNATFNIRIMAPFNMRCNMCKEYIYKGKKFNSRKEDVMDETYLGLRIFRFYIKCPRCVSEIAFKTDLENTDYTLEAGAKRLFEAEKIAQQMAEEERKAKEEDEMNPMKMLENRTKASRAEMDQIDTLEELREMNTRKNQVNTDAMIEKYRKYEELLAQLQMEQEEEEIKEIFGEKGDRIVKRLEDSDSDDEPKEKKLKVDTAPLSGKPTDILAEDNKASTSQKAPESWQKSVGSLSSKQKLKGLVVKKKSTLPVVTSMSANGVDKDSAGTSRTSSSVNEAADSSTKLTEKNGETNRDDKIVNAKNQGTESTNEESSSGNKDDEKLTRSTESGSSKHTDSENLSDVNSSGGGNTVSDSKTLEQVSASGSTGMKSSALGLLGTYSDSESETDSG